VNIESHDVFESDIILLKDERLKRDLNRQLGKRKSPKREASCVEAAFSLLTTRERLLWLYRSL